MKHFNPKTTRLELKVKKLKNNYVITDDNEIAFLFKDGTLRGHVGTTGYNGYFLHEEMAENVLKAHNERR